MHALHRPRCPRWFDRRAARLAIEHAQGSASSRRRRRRAWARVLRSSRHHAHIARGSHRAREEDPISAACVGYAAGALTVASYVPQAVRVWRTKETKDLSYGMFDLLVTASALWITYGAISSQSPLIATNVACGLLNVAILVAKL